MQSLNIGKRVIKSAAGTAEHMYLTAAAAERKPDGCEHVGIILFHRQPHRIHSLRALGGIVIADINIRRDTERIEIFVSAVRCNNKTVRSKRTDLRHTGIVARAENKTAGGIIFIQICLSYFGRGYAANYAARPRLLILPQKALHVNLFAQKAELDRTCNAKFYMYADENLPLTCARNKNMV